MRCLESLGLCRRAQPPSAGEGPEATVVSDGLGCFGAATSVGAEHERHVTGSGKTSAKLPQFKPVHTLLGELKTATSDSHHAFDFAKYAQRHLTEFQSRFDRGFGMKISQSRLLTALLLAPPTSERVLRAAEVSCWSGW